MINCCRFVFNNNIDSWGGQEENFLASFQTVSRPLSIFDTSPKMAASNQSASVRSWSRFWRLRRCVLYEYHYQFLPELLIQLNCFPSLYL